jgi:hypothetical protein
MTKLKRDCANVERLRYPHGVLSSLEDGKPSLSVKK